MQQPEYTQLPPEHSPLIELATRLGYVVYSYTTTPPNNSKTCLGSPLPHYRIDDGLGRSSDSNDLVDALAFMIKRDMLSITSPIS